MRKKRAAPALLLPHGVRALVPVFAPVGGAGRSTMAGLLAQVLAPTTRTLVVDPAPPASSPWPAWLGNAGRPHPGLPAVVSPGPAASLASVVGRPVPLGGRGRRASRGLDEALDVGSGGPGGPGYDVLTDCRPLTAPPVVVSEDPRWYADVLESGSWFAGVIDLGMPALASHVRARNADQASVIDAWWRRTDAVPVVVLPSSGDGVRAARQLLALLDRDGLSPARIVLAAIDIAGPGVARSVHTQIAGLAGGGGDAHRVAAVVPVPYDPAIREHGLKRLDLVSHSVLSAVTDIARIVVSAVRPHREAPAGAGPGEARRTGVREEPATDGAGTDAAAEDRTAEERTAERTATAAHERTRAPGWVPIRHRVAATPYDPSDPSEPSPAAPPDPAGAAAEEPRSRA
jgi:hypothetical protein